VSLLGCRYSIKRGMLPLSIYNRFSPWTRARPPLDRFRLLHRRSFPFRVETILLSIQVPSMARSLGISRYHLLIALTILFSSRAIATGISIGEYEGFGYMRPCAQGCLTDIGNDPYSDNDAIRNAIGCAGPAQNECYCRADLQTPASSWLSRCATSRCGTTASVDQASVLSIYQHYCATAMATVEGGNAGLVTAGGLPRQTGFLSSASPLVRSESVMILFSAMLAAVALG